MIFIFKIIQLSIKQLIWNLIQRWNIIISEYFELPFSQFHSQRLSVYSLKKFQILSNFVSLLITSIQLIQRKIFSIYDSYFSAQKSNIIIFWKIIKYLYTKLTNSVSQNLTNSKYLLSFINMLLFIQHQ
ncbi:unnamed protein product (macronuclear) [Paramecium tetraurelia]|uniref:Transmembrane protein n=1 Tax=Paramecium tetraurelia TaxID=5888 RepID=A0DWN3_PARTE|nr:uncharacterized protein GSPATT00021093001 [Paramecium tetraurelia]CAK87450.1 unnamed protein product [Paramecium tetraurelia]|eukprot:XP_001454847.1 hypothetical protein (macronuclear) [Paramecium tetraurelia strain d4-2]